MGISFLSSLFGLAGSCPRLPRPAIESGQNRFYTDLEDWLASTVRGYARDDARRHGVGPGLQQSLDRLRQAVEEGGGNRTATAAMANLAEAIQGLVAHMRTSSR